MAADLSNTTTVRRMRLGLAATLGNLERNTTHKFLPGAIGTAVRQADGNYWINITGPDGVEYAGTVSIGALYLGHAVRTLPTGGG